MRCGGGPPNHNPGVTPFIRADGFSADGQKADAERFERGYLKTQPPKIFPVGLCTDAKSRRTQSIEVPLNHNVPQKTETKSGNWTF